MKKAVVLLGSGFSIPFGGPSSGDLLHLIETDPYTNNTDTFQSQLVTQLLIFLRNFYGFKQVNFETLLASLESLYQYTTSFTQKQKSVSYSSLMPAIYDLKYKQELIIKEAEIVNKPIPSYLIDVYKHCICSILHQIYKYDNLNTIQKVEPALNNGLHNFVKALIDNEYSIKFYTTNYDRIVPRLLPDIEFDEGLKEIVHENSFNEEFGNNSWGCPADTLNQEFDFSHTVAESQDAKPLLFHNDLMRFSQARYTYYNLHGSRYLSVSYPDGKPYFNINGTDYASAIGRYCGSNPNEYLMFTPIIAGYTKSQRALTEPFHFGFTSFTIDCNTCDKFFSLGYSYRDPHINSIISSNLQEDVSLECIVNNTINEEIITPEQLKLQKESPIRQVKNCTRGRIFEGGIEEYFEKRMYEDIL